MFKTSEFLTEKFDFSIKLVQFQNSVTGAALYSGVLLELSFTELSYLALIFSALKY